MAAPFPECMQTLIDPDCLVDTSADMKNMKAIFKYNESQWMVTAEQKMPWPIKNRELCMTIGSFLDPYNKAAFTISLSVPEE